MPSSQEAVVCSEQDLAVLLSTIWKGKSVKVKWATVGDKRSLSANSLYWVWLTVIAQSYTKRLKKDFDQEGMHYVMRAQFLGTEDIVVGKMVIENQLKSTKGMESTPFCEYMTKIEAWAINHGIPLPHPPANEYTDYWQAQH